MAALKITLTYQGTFSRNENTDASAIRATLKPGRSWHLGGYDLAVDVTEDGPHVDVHLVFSASTDETQRYSAGQRLTRLHEGLNSITKERFREWRISSTPDLKLVGTWFEDATPVVTSVEVPLLAEDRNVAVDDATLRQLLVNAVEDTYPFWCDQRERMDAVKSALAHGTIIVSASDPTAAVEVASAYLSATRHRPVRPKLLPRRPVWAAASTPSPVSHLECLGCRWVGCLWLRSLARPC